MANPVTPLMALMTLASWTFMSVRALCLGWMQVAAALMRVSRWRQEDRHTQISSPGRQERLSSPKVWRVCSHWQSAMSVVRPGTCVA